MATALTRRGLVSAAPAAIVAAAATSAIAAPMVDHPDAELLALRVPFRQTWNAFDAALKEQNAAEEAKDEIALVDAEALVDRTDNANRTIVEAMCEIPALTIEGIAFKAKVSLENEENRYEELVTSIMDDILAMAGGLNA